MMTAGGDAAEATTTWLSGKDDDGAVGDDVYRIVSLDDDVGAGFSKKKDNAGDDNDEREEELEEEEIKKISEHGEATLTADDDTEDMEDALTEDIYSLMCVSPVFSASFIFAFLVFSIQFALTLLVLLDLVDDSDEPFTTNGEVNWLFLPVDVPWEVTAAQFIAILLIVNFACGQGDLLVGFIHLVNGYNPAILEELPLATCWKWYFAGTCQFLVGAFLIIPLFILMMQSETNIDLCLNFTALYFVQEIDDVAFTMAALGLISRRVQNDCNHVGEIMIPRRQGRRNDWIKRVFIVILTVVLYTFYGIIVGWQIGGRFMCRSLYIQFGDVWGPEWPYYSGVFSTENFALDNRIDNRAVYIDPTNTIRVAYCASEQAWTFSNMTETNDHCNYFIKSSETFSYDIMEIASDPWYALNVDLGEVPMDWLSMDCNDCNDKLCPAEAGTCVNNNCVCNGDDRIGLHCEFLDDEENLCNYLALDRRSKADVSALPFANLFTGREYSQYERATVRTMYHRPIYISVNRITQRVDIFIIFSGYRWIIFGVPQETSSNLTVDEFGTFLEQNDAQFEPLQTLNNIKYELPSFVPFFYSLPFQVKSETHQVDPVTAQWVLAKLDPTLPIVGAYADINHEVSANFICANCNNSTNPCLNGGFCDDGLCDCNTTGIQSYGGSLCEYAFSCSEFNKREGLEDGLNGCVCDPVFDVCTACEHDLFYGNLCQFRRGEPIVQETETIFLTGRDECLNETCQNGGFCISNVQSCKCPDFYEGIYCENFVPPDTVPPCDNSTCLNDGYCSEGATEDVCTCVGYYTGDKCEVLSPLYVFNLTNATNISMSDPEDYLDDDNLIGVDGDNLGDATTADDDAASDLVGGTEFVIIPYSESTPEPEETDDEAISISWTSEETVAPEDEGNDNQQGSGNPQQQGNPQQWYPFL